ncbi:MAG: hypothetical protein JO261_04425 [Alphaproteobacteria bacterium]|nr:hypothetical protein [Alphaproteobacteria bacterium]MBV9692926.1 hypothetical protein [Alphaproteobacteria bacterium]
MKFGLVFAAAAALALTGSAADAQGFSLTQFFATSNLEPLSGTPTMLNLGAQMDHRTFQQDVNNFDDFMLIDGTGKKRVMFNRHLMKQGSMALGSWVGVAQFDNHSITADLQAGWQAVKAKYSLTTGLAHVIVYKTLNTSQLVYDYAVQLGNSDMNCQEYLYTPATGAFQPGFRTGCWIGMSTANSRKTSAGSGTRAQ